MAQDSKPAIEVALEEALALVRKTHYMELNGKTIRVRPYPVAFGEISGKLKEINAIWQGDIKADVARDDD